MISVVLLYTVRKAIKAAHDGQKSMTSVLLRISLNYIQTMSVMEFVKVAWPNEVIELFKVFSYLGSVNKVAFGIS